MSDPSQRPESKQRLYNLLPEIYRTKDVERDYILCELLAVIEDELTALEADVDRLYDNWFIETCEEWVIPYIAGLLGVRTLNNVETTSVQSMRAYVAKTLSYRRRKGTATGLEQLARDVTGWPVHVVEFFERLNCTVNLNHIQPRRKGTIDIRDLEALEQLNSPFDCSSHTVEVRTVTNGRGKYNAPNVGAFVWRLQPYYVERVEARPIGTGWFTFSPIGIGAPLFNLPATEPDIIHLTTEVNVPGKLRRRALADALADYRAAFASSPDTSPNVRYFGNPPALAIYEAEQETPLKPDELCICDLSHWDTHRERPGSARYKAAVDPQLGRLVFLNDSPPERARVTYAYGFSGDIGGGPYPRQMNDDERGYYTWRRRVSTQSAQGADYRTISDALKDWSTSKGDKTHALITIIDNGTYAETISIAPSEGRTLKIEAQNRKRPVLQLVGDGEDPKPLLQITDGRGADTTITLEGLLVEGGINVHPDSVGCLKISHCTLVPGWNVDENGEAKHADQPSVVVESPNSHLQLEIDHCITGALNVSSDVSSLLINDSLITAQQPQARHVPALLSGSLPKTLSLSAASPRLEVSIGAQGPHVATLARTPSTIIELRDELEAALHRADASPAFTEARVIVAGNQLVVLSGTAGEVAIDDVPHDATASELRLVAPLARQVYALLGCTLPDRVTFTSRGASVSVTISDMGSNTVVLRNKPLDLSSVCRLLERGIQKAFEHQVAKPVLVGLLDNALLVVPAVAGSAVTLGATPHDAATVEDLGLNSAMVSIASDRDAFSGPHTTVERATVFGEVHATKLKAVDSLFCDKLVIQQRQAGSVLCSYVPPDSLTPRRYRCQPDLALRVKATAGPKALQRFGWLFISESGLLAQMKPQFTSTTYGHPGYGQLSLRCPTEIRAGASNGAEMGAFNYLKQPQRESNLRAAIDEYLPFGLESGVFFVT